MNKKLLGFGSIAALVLFSGSVALADTWTPSGDLNSKITVKNDSSATINTGAFATSNTGNNSAGALSGSMSGSSRANGGMILTGAANAMTGVLVGVNDNQTQIDQTGNAGARDGDTTLTANVKNKNHATVNTMAASLANTGNNTADAASGSMGGSSRAKGGMINTGDATALTTVGVVANTNWTTVTQ